MGKIVTNGAMLQCSFGTTPCSLAVSDPTRPQCGNMLVATIQDNTPANIPTFGMCQSIANPQVQTATSAAMGTLPVYVARNDLRTKSGKHCHSRCEIIKTDGIDFWGFFRLYREFILFLHAKIGFNERKTTSNIDSLPAVDMLHQGGRNHLQAQS